MKLKFNIEIEDDEKGNINIKWNTKNISHQQKLQVMIELLRHIIQDILDDKTLNEESRLYSLFKLRDFVLKLCINCLYGTIDSLLEREYRPKFFTMSIFEPMINYSSDSINVCTDTIIVGDLDAHDPLQGAYKLIERAADCMLEQLDLEPNEVTDIIMSSMDMAKNIVKLHIATQTYLEDEDEDD